MPRAPAEADLAAAFLPRPGPTPPALPEGACWQAHVTPAVIQTVTEQVQATPERRAPDGTVLAAATFRTETRQQILSDRRDTWFETPCPEDLTVDTLATLQRALKARGVYLDPITGRMDGATRAAIRAWQGPRGIDSDVLSLAGARALGVIAAPRG